jgi:hypothetical protein
MVKRWLKVYLRRRIMKMMNPRPITAENQNLLSLITSGTELLKKVTIRIAL